MARRRPSKDAERRDAAPAEPPEPQTAWAVAVEMDAKEGPRLRWVHPEPADAALAKALADEAPFCILSETASSLGATRPARVAAKFVVATPGRRYFACGAAPAREKCEDVAPPGHRSRPAASIETRATPR